MTTPPIPTVEAVGRIAALADPVVRNLQITQCYHELSRVLAGPAGGEANWCTFATWASKQAGQTIRGEDLARAVEDRLRRAPELREHVARVVKALDRLGRGQDVPALREALLEACDLPALVRQVGTAVAGGNLKVFAEIGHAFARFLAEVGPGERPDPEALARFCATLRPGDPPEGQGLLRDAFALYGEARAEEDPGRRAELLFCANLLVGLHEQTRLQPEIAAALDGPFGEAGRLRQCLLRVLLPGFWLRLRLRFARLLPGPLPLDVALDSLVQHVRRHVRQAVTEALLTLHLADDLTLRLGRDLDAPYPLTLARLRHPRLLTLLAQVDPTPDSPAHSGAVDWADLPDRMHFITDFFRCYHAWPSLFAAPFTPAQLEDLRVGRRPPGRL